MRIKIVRCLNITCVMYERESFSALKLAKRHSGSDKFRFGEFAFMLHLKLHPCLRPCVNIPRLEVQVSPHTLLRQLPRFIRTQRNEYY